MICINCKATNNDNAKFCYACGTRIVKEENNSQTNEIRNSSAVPTEPCEKEIANDRENETGKEARIPAEAAAKRKNTVQKTAFSYVSGDYAYIRLDRITDNDVYCFSAIDRKAKVTVPGTIVRNNIREPEIGGYYWAVLENIYKTVKDINFFSKAFFCGTKKANNGKGFYTLYENHRTDEFIPAVVGSVTKDYISAEVGPGAQFKCRKPDNFNLEPGDPALFRVQNLKSENNRITGEFEWCEDNKVPKSETQQKAIPVFTVVEKTDGKAIAEKEQSNSEDGRSAPKTTDRMRAMLAQTIKRRKLLFGTR